MGFDASKLKDDPNIADVDSSSLVGRIPDVGSRVAVDAAIPQSIDLDVVAGGWARGGVLASRSVATLENPLLRAFVGFPSRSTLEAARPSGVCGWGTSEFGDSPLFKTISKFGSLAVAESQASTVIKASTTRAFADSFRNLDPLKESTRSWQSIYDVSLGKTAIEQAATMKQAFSSHYVNNAFGSQRHLDIPSLGTGTGTAQGFLRAYESLASPLLGAFNSPLFADIGKAAVGFASVAQRLGKWVERWSRPLAESFEWLRREMDQWPMDPYGEPVPVQNVLLYRLAIAAYEGDPVAQARFLNEIDAGDFLGDVSLVDDLLKPTFDPKRPDLRKDWWLMEPAEASCWLRKRLRDLRTEKDSEREKAERLYAQRERTELLQVEGKRILRATARDVLDFDPDLIEFERRERETFLHQRIHEMLPEILPERQLQIFLYLAEEMPLKQIAHRLGLSEGTIKSHAHRMRANLRANPELLQVLRLNGTLG